MGHHCPVSPEQAPSHLRLGLALLEADHPEEARAALEGAPSGEETTVDPTVVPLHHWALAYSSWLVGRWDRAAIEVQAGLAAAEASGGALHGVALAGVGVLVAVHRDDLGGARCLLSRVQRHLLAEAAPCPLWSQGAEALLMEAEGQPEMALAVLADGWVRAGQERHMSAYRLFGPALVRLAMRYGDRFLAASVAADVEERAGRLSEPAAQGAALLGRGLLHDDPAALLQAVASLREVSRPLELASACEEAAASLRRAGRTSLATSLYGQALIAYQGLGATRDVARAGAALAPDADRAVVTPQGAPAFLGEAGLQGKLSTREREVLALMATGVNSRTIAQQLFLSHNTVRNHAQSILRKLGVHSRLEAVSLARRQGLLRPPHGFRA